MARSNQRICRIALRRTNRPSASSLSSWYPWTVSHSSRRAAISCALCQRAEGSLSRQRLTTLTSSLSILGPQLAEIGRRLARRDLHHVVVALRDPRPPPGEELEEHHAEGEQVGARVDVVARRDLGRHVRGLALAHPGERLGEPLLGLGHAEVGDLHLALEPAEHVAGREIAVHQVEQLAALGAERVGGGEAAANPGGDVHHHPLGERLARLEDRLHEAEQRHALDQLEGEVLALLVAPPPDDLDHVRVAERGRHPHLVEELLGEGRILRDVGVEPLHRDEPARAPVGREHPAEIHARGLARGDLGEGLERDRALQRAGLRAARIADRAAVCAGSGLRRARGERRHAARVYQTWARAAAIACGTPPMSALRCRSR